MHDYDFQILQPIEFENLTRDLLQKKEGIFVESFTVGRDGGIDLRFGQVKGNRGVIVQAKRYRDYKTLFGTLKTEIDKVRRINPSRYVLSTSVGLTPGNKDDILKLFSPYIQTTEDIIGRDDLNNLLGQYRDIEKKYYKLWLGSSAVLEGILNKRIENWSTIELEETRKTVSLYVMNDSFVQAEKILKENRYIIISGIPGIGKTTLARMLVYNILASGYEEYVKMNSMDDAAQKLTVGKKQIFMYDDFLGHSFLEIKEAGFENKVLSFIEKVKRENDKLFILSTREYILSSAKREFEGFSLRNIELAKCTLDLSYYSESIRASILYNHLASISLPTEYVHALLNGNQYLKLVKHKNFNPRIIEAFLNDKLYLKETPQGFVNRFLDFFDRPLSVWEFAFSKMTTLTQDALIVRASMGSESVFLTDWLRATELFLKGKSNNPTFTLHETEWNNVIKDLLGSFITSSLSQGETLIDFNNPSVYDFLIDYLRQRKTIQHYLINNAFFFNQITGTFSNSNSVYRGFGRIDISSEFDSDIIRAFVTHLSKPKTCKTGRINNIVFREKPNIVRYILAMFDCFPVLLRNNPSIYSKSVTQELFENPNYTIYSRVQLLDKINVDICHIDLESLTDSVLSEISWVHEFEDALDLLERTDKGRALLEDSEFVKRVDYIIGTELNNATSESDCQLIRDSVENLSEHIPGLDIDSWREEIEETANAFSAPEPEYDDWDTGERYVGKSYASADYFDMFSSLIDCK